MADSVSITSMMLALKTAIINPAQSIDDACFRLHHLYTARILAITVFLSLLYKVLDPITCFTTIKDFPEKALNSYCLMQNTYTLPDSVDGNIGTEVIHQGIENDIPGTLKQYLLHYQWVPIMLLAQAVLFILPHYLWTMQEKNEIGGLVLDMRNPIIPEKLGATPIRSKGGASSQENETDPLTPEDCCSHSDVQVYRVAWYLKNNSKGYRGIAMWYLCCTFLNLLNVVLQIVFTNRFLDNEWFINGWGIFSVLNKNYHERTDKLVTIFPRVTKCTFKLFGVAGDVQHHDALCILPFNFFYEMVYVFNLYWFMFVAIITTLFFLYYLIIIPFHSVNCCNRSKFSKELSKVLKELDFGRGFVLLMLSKHMSRVHFVKLVKKLNQMAEKGPL